MTAAPRRRRAWRYGRWAEALCAAVLVAKGYRVITRDFRCAVGEVDILARRGNVLVAVEVKARRDAASAAAAVLPRQQRRVVRATEAFLRLHPGTTRLRFDVMLVGGWRLPRHIPDAWRPEG